MRLKLFSLPNLTLLVALSLSAVAAFYSIIGLTAIFAGAVIPVIIMGCILEVAKLTTTVWLRKYWKKAGWILKSYLVPAVITLAFITSLGIFGLLSKAHIDQGVGGGDVSAKVSLIDEKIKTQRENIKASREALAQMDMQVNNVIIKGDSEKSAERSVLIRRQQTKERGILTKEIDTANNLIGKLNEERAPIASQQRKVEAEVGPIKYVAAMIYGDNLDANLLEKAVRWVIILLVLVFDPLAVALLLAANQSRDWENEDPEEEEKRAIASVDFHLGPDDPGPIERTEYEPDDGPLTEDQVEQIKEIAKEPEHEPVMEPIPEPEVVFVPEVHPATPEPINLTNEYVTYEGKHMHREALRGLHPELFLTTSSRPVSSNFGTAFPHGAKGGDIFIRVDMLPNKVFKFDGTRWIEVSKENATSYLSIDYLKHLIAKIDAGEYDVENLSEPEKAQLEEFLSNNKSI